MLGGNDEHAGLMKAIEADERATLKKANDPHWRDKEPPKPVYDRQKEFLNSKLNVYSMLREVRKRGGCARLEEIATARILVQLGEACEEEEGGKKGA